MTELVKKTENGQSNVMEGESFTLLQRICKCLVASGDFKNVRDVSQAVSRAMVGMEIGQGVTWSLMNISIIEGKPSFSASGMGAMIKASGKYRYRVTEHTRDRCEIEFLERVDGVWESVGNASFDMEDAKAAGLAGRKNWSAYGRNMLFARALSNGCRWFCPDVLMGNAYTPEDFGYAEDETPASHAKTPFTPSQAQVTKEAIKPKRVTKKKVRKVKEEVATDPNSGLVEVVDVEIIEAEIVKEGVPTEVEENMRAEFDKYKNADLPNDEDLDQLPF
jgi:hypothetical protein